MYNHISFYKTTYHGLFHTIIFYVCYILHVLYTIYCVYNLYNIAIYLFLCIHVYVVYLYAILHSYNHTHIYNTYKHIYNHYTYLHLPVLYYKSFMPYANQRIPNSTVLSRMKLEKRQNLAWELLNRELVSINSFLLPTVTKRSQLLIKKDSKCAHNVL